VSWLWIPIAFAAALLAAAAATPLASRLSIALGAIDRPNERKVSARANIPRWGGLAVALGTFVGIGVALLIAPTEKSFQETLSALLVGSMLVLGVGAMDDRWALAAWPKLAVELVAAGIAFAAGLRIEHVTDPILGTDGNLYGTTSLGGANGSKGTIYEVTPAGQLTTLYSFTSTNGNYTKGSFPNGALLLHTNGTFYGIAAGGR
jgi:uncharacterized repeat protein (TIGR03803 family)